MAHAISRELERRFEDAERAGLLLVPAEESMRRALKGRCAGGKGVVSPFPQMYARAGAWGGLSWRERARRVIRTHAAMHPQRVACSYTAAFMHGLWVPKARVVSAVHVVGGMSRASGRIAWHGIDVAESVVVDGVRVTGLARTAFDCARELDFRNGLAVADSMLRVMGSDVAASLAAIEREAAGHRGINRLRSLLPHADARSESGGESYARAVMIENGVLLPDLQVEVARPDDPARTYRLDYLWRLRDGMRVAGELDGYEKTADPQMLAGRTSAEALRAERLRESHLTALGIRVARFTFDMARRTRPLLDTLDMFGIPRIGAM